MFYGLTIIAIAWFFQYLTFRSGYRSLSLWFLRLSALGMIILLAETFNRVNLIHSLPALVALILIFILLWKSDKK